MSYLGVQGFASSQIRVFLGFDYFSSNFLGAVDYGH